MKKAINRVLFIVVLVIVLYDQACANSGDYFTTIYDGNPGMVAIGMDIDSENNVYVLLQSGSTICSSGGGGGYSCNWTWDTGTGKTIVKVYQKVVQKTEIAGTGGTNTTINDLKEWLKSSDFIGTIELLELRFFSFCIHILVIFTAIYCGLFITRPRILSIKKQETGKK